jgi:hypothetical protein
MTAPRKPFKDRYVSRVEHERVIASAEKIHAETIAGDNALMELLKRNCDMWREMYFEGWLPVAVPAAIMLGVMCGSWLAMVTR